MTDWQLIETAPRDGTHILLLTHRMKKNEHALGDPEIVIGAYTDVWVLDNKEWVAILPGALNGDRGMVASLTIRGGYPSPICDVGPTHWMPLPSAPVPVTSPPVAGVDKAGDTCSPVSPAANSDQFAEPTGLSGGDGRRRTDDQGSVDVEVGSVGESPAFNDHEINATAQPIPEASPKPAPNTAFLTEAEALEIPEFLRRKKEASHG